MGEIDGIRGGVPYGDLLVLLVFYQSIWMDYLAVSCYHYLDSS